MYYNDWNGEKLSALGFGTMRLPTMAGGTAADINKPLLREMLHEAVAGGINYFDTAWTYHDSVSERVVGELLSEFPRESYYLATKFPGHQIQAHYDPREIFETQLAKCRVDFFDFYLFHNVNDLSINTYLDERWGILDYILQQKKCGRIRHLGFSCHGSLDCLDRFITAGKGELEFCQIQLNYLDWTLQDARAKYDLISKRGLGVWVMEPVRGGKLAHLPAEEAALLQRLHPGESAASWAFRWLQGLPNVKMILSGMSAPDQLRDNLDTFSLRRPLSADETDVLSQIAEKLKSFVPCTACRYCCEGCPRQLNIPGLIALYNDLHLDQGANISIYVDSIAPGKGPENCIGCGRCAKSCPQGIDVPSLMREMHAAFSALPSWAEICRARDAAMQKAAAQP